MTEWITLSAARSYMQWGTDTSRDAVLQTVIDSAVASIERIKGHIVQAAVTGEVQDVADRGIVILDESPVLSVQSVSFVQAGSTPVAIPKADPVNGVLTGWTLASGGGVLTVPTGFCGLSYGAQVVVDYTVGRAPIPADWTEAALELIAFLWDSSQNNSEGDRAGVGAPDDDWPNRGSNGIGAYAMPFRVRELLGIYGKTVRSAVFAR